MNTDISDIWILIYLISYFSDIWFIWYLIYLINLNSDISDISDVWYIKYLNTDICDILILIYLISDYWNNWYLNTDICWTARSMERFFFFLKKYCSAPGERNCPNFFSRGVFPSYYHVISDFCHIWGPFMAKIEEMCQKSAFLVVPGQNH